MIDNRAATIDAPLFYMQGALWFMFDGQTLFVRLGGIGKHVPVPRLPPKIGSRWQNTRTDRLCRVVRVQPGKTLTGVHAGQLVPMVYVEYVGAPKRVFGTTLCLWHRVFREDTTAATPITRVS